MPPVRPSDRSHKRTHTSLKSLQDVLRDSEAEIVPDSQDEAEEAADASDKVAIKDAIPSRHRHPFVVVER